MTRKSLSRSAGGYALTALCLTLLIMTGLSCFAGPAASRTPDIYIAGFFRDGETEKPCYWVNGERKVLSLPVSVYDFGVRDIAAGEGIICVAGYYRIFPDDIAPTACYWEDGVRTDLPAPIRSIEIETITAADGKVYAAGEYFDDNTRKRKVCYWIDGIRTDLSESQKDELYIDYTMVLH